MAAPLRESVPVARLISTGAGGVLVVPAVDALPCGSIGAGAPAMRDAELAPTMASGKMYPPRGVEPAIAMGACQGSAEVPEDGATFATGAGGRLMPAMLDGGSPAGTGGAMAISVFGAAGTGSAGAGVGFTTAAGLGEGTIAVFAIVIDGAVIGVGAGSGCCRRITGWG
jgi:hypothetical protein